MRGEGGHDAPEFLALLYNDCATAGSGPHRHQRNDGPSAAVRPG